MTPTNPTPPPSEDRLAMLATAVRDLHRWDVTKGFGKFNTILGRIDDHLAALAASPAKVSESETMDPDCECGEPKSAGIHDSIRTWVRDPNKLHAFRAAAEPREGVDGLRALSEAATPGTWSLGPPNQRPSNGRAGDRQTIVLTPDPALLYPANLDHWYVLDGKNANADAEFIVAAVNYIRLRLTRPTGATGEEPSE